MGEEQTSVVDDLWEDDLFGEVGDSDPLRLVVCDDHLLFRRGLLTALEGATDIEVVAEVEDGAEAVRICREMTPDLMTVPLALGAGAGPGVALAATHALPTLGVIMLTVDDDEVHAAALAVRSGATGLLDKVDAVEGVFDTLRFVGRGQPALTPEVWAAVCASIDPAVGAELTDVEREVVSHLVDPAHHGRLAPGPRNHARNVLAKIRRHPPAEVVAWLEASALHPDRPIGSS